MQECLLLPSLPQGVPAFLNTFKHIHSETIRLDDLLAPILFDFWCQFQHHRLDAAHFEFGPAVGARQNLAALNVRGGNITAALWATCHDRYPFFFLRKRCRAYRKALLVKDEQRLKSASWYHLCLLAP